MHALAGIDTGRKMKNFNGVRKAKMCPLYVLSYSGVAASAGV